MVESKTNKGEVYGKIPQAFASIWESKQAYFFALGLQNCYKEKRDPLDIFPCNFVKYI